MVENTTPQRLGFGYNAPLHNCDSGATSDPTSESNESEFADTESGTDGVVFLFLLSCEIRAEAAWGHPDQAARGDECYGTQPADALFAGNIDRLRFRFGGYTVAPGAELDCAVDAADAQLTGETANDGADHPVVYVEAARYVVGEDVVEEFFGGIGNKSEVIVLEWVSLDVSDPVGHGLADFLGRFGPIAFDVDVVGCAA